MGNKSSDVCSTTRGNVQSYLQLYSPICECVDQNLGKLKIYRKKQFNFDYIALSEKTMNQQFVEDCRKLLKLGTKNRDPFFHDNRIIKQGQTWLKVFVTQSFCNQSSGGRSNHAKILLQYLNYSLKQYVCQYTMTLHNSPNKNQVNKSAQQTPIPKQIAYILGNILDAYVQLRLLHQNTHCINILAMISAITNPNLIYVNLQGCLKFLPLPLFIFSDYFSKMDKCMIHCCNFVNQQSEINGKNIIIPKYGNSVIGTNESLEKLDKIFMNKFKKLMKFISGEMAIEFNNRGSNESSQEMTTHLGSLENRPHIRTPSHQTNYHIGKATTGPYKKVRPQLSFWNQLEYLNSYHQIIKKLKNIQNMPQHLQFGSNHEAYGKKEEKKARQDKIRLQKSHKNKNSLNSSMNTYKIANKSIIGPQKNVKNQMRNSFVNNINQINQNTQTYNPYSLNKNTQQNTNTSNIFSKEMSRFDNGRQQQGTQGTRTERHKTQNNYMLGNRISATLL